MLVFFFFPGFGGPDRSFWSDVRRGRPAENFGLWADFSFLKSRGSYRGRSRGRTRGSTRGPTRGAPTRGPTCGSRFAFACSVRRPSSPSQISASKIMLFLLRRTISEAKGPPQFQENALGVKRPISGALRAFRGILTATLRVQKTILGMRNPILGMASHDLCNAEPTILGATPGAIPEIYGNPHQK